MFSVSRLYCEDTADNASLRDFRWLFGSVHETTVDKMIPFPLLDTLSHTGVCLSLHVKIFDRENHNELTVLWHGTRDQSLRNWADKNWDDLVSRLLVVAGSLGLSIIRQADVPHRGAIIFVDDGLCRWRRSDRGDRCGG